MAPRSTALAGAQLASRQLNCESVFRGVLSYGRGWNNAPAVSVKPRRSAQPGWIATVDVAAQEGRENANIDAGLGFIWRISDRALEPSPNPTDYPQGRTAQNPEHGD